MLKLHFVFAALALSFTTLGWAAPTPMEENIGRRSRGSGGTRRSRLVRQSDNTNGEGVPDLYHDPPYEFPMSFGGPQESNFGTYHPVAPSLYYNVPQHYDYTQYQHHDYSQPQDNEYYQPPNYEYNLPQQPEQPEAGQMDPFSTDRTSRLPRRYAAIQELAEQTRNRSSSDSTFSNDFTSGAAFIEHAAPSPRLQNNRREGIRSSNNRRQSNTNSVSNSEVVTIPHSAARLRDAIIARNTPRLPLTEEDLLRVVSDFERANFEDDQPMSAGGPRERRRMLRNAERRRTRAEGSSSHHNDVMNHVLQQHQNLQGNMHQDYTNPMANYSGNRVMTGADGNLYLWPQGDQSHATHSSDGASSSSSSSSANRPSGEGASSSRRVRTPNQHGLPPMPPSVASALETVMTSTQEEPTYTPEEVNEILTPKNMKIIHGNIKDSMLIRKLDYVQQLLNSTFPTPDQLIRILYANDTADVREIVLEFASRFFPSNSDSNPTDSTPRKG